MHRCGGGSVVSRLRNLFTLSKGRADSQKPAWFSKRILTKISDHSTRANSPETIPDVGTVELTIAAHIRDESSRRYEAGEVIIRENDVGETAYVITHGQVEVTKQLDGQNVHLGYRGAGEIFGEMSMIDEKPRSATVTAVTETLVSEIRRDDFFKSFQTDPKVALELLQVLFERLRESDARFLVGHLQRSLLKARVAAHAAEVEHEQRLVAEIKQRDAEQAKDKVTNILESIGDAFCAFDEEWRFAYINGKAEEGLANQNFERKALLGKVLWEVFPEEVGTRWYDALQRAMRARVPVTCEFYYRRLDKWYEDSVAPMPGGGIGIYRRDMTARKQAEQRLAKALGRQAALYQFLERRHRAQSLEEIYDAALDAILSALDCSRAAILLLDDSGMMRFAGSRGLSEEFCKFVESYSSWKVDPSNSRAVCVSDVAAADLDESLEAIVVNESIGAFSVVPLVVNGRLAGQFTTYYNGPHVFDEEELELSLTVARQLAAGIERKEAENELKRFNEELERRVAQRTEELQRANTALVRDIEQREKLEKQLVQAQKMESVGTLAGGIAHDFNNLLNIIQGYAFILRGHCEQNDEMEESLVAINDTVQRGSALVHQLLTLGRRSRSTELKSVDLNSLVERLIVLIRQTFPKTIELDHVLQTDMPRISGDENQIEQALLNLCVNARDAMANRGILTFKTRSVTGATLQHLGDNLEDLYVCVEVTDTGVGMDERVRTRIFEPFFTTKDKGGGTGLGLSVVYGIVKNHNGCIDVDSKPMAGASFRLYFPAQPADAVLREPIAKVDSQPAVASDRSATVLVVEDEERMLHALGKILGKQGYKVLKASDGEMALETYQRHEDSIDVVLLDLGLPKMSGRDVLFRIKNKNPDVKVVIASGHFEDELDSGTDQAGVKHLLRKPYMPDEVIKILQSLTKPNLPRSVPKEA